jgi:mRNA-degrading endonuclease RelE of RelBE toxin-antitoxin system
LETSYTIELSDVAEKVYERIYEDAQACLKRGDESNSKVKQLRIVDDVLDRLIPHDPFAPERGLSGFLSGIFRIKKGRTRICYVGSSEHRKITVLYISDTPRKEGDSRDPYKVLTRLVKSGKFDDLLDNLGVQTPLKKSIEYSHSYPSSPFLQ